MPDYKEQIKKILKKEVKFNLENVQIEIPPSSELGDYAFPCFVLSKHLKKDPTTIAKELESKIKLTKNFQTAKAIGPYLNFFVNRTSIAETTITEILRRKSKYGSSNEGKGVRALIEHTSINPNASPHVGRARNAILGDCFSRLLKFQGYSTEVHYYVNDIGKQIAMLVLGARKRKNVSFENLLEIYVEINKRIEEDKGLEKEVFKLLHDLEKGNTKIKSEFSKVVNICITGQSKLLNDFGIKYDFYDKESKYLWNKKTEEILSKLEKTKKLFTDEESRKVLDLKGKDLPMKTPVFVLTRGDGTSLYPLRDLAYTIEKLEIAPKKNLWILGEDHKLYYLQLKAALELLNKQAPEIIHYSFILLQEGKMSTRQGRVVLLEDLMREAVKKAQKELAKRKIKDSELLAKQIGYGAIKFAILRVSPEKNVLFDWDKALSFEGETGPYIQYAITRANSILKKAGINKGKIEYGLLAQQEEHELINLLNSFPNIISESLDNRKPHLLCRYLSDLSQKFNEFYHTCPVISDKKDIMLARLALVKAVNQVLGNGLNLLGIEVPKRM